MADQPPDVVELQPYESPRTDLNGDNELCMITASAEPVPMPVSASTPATVSWVRWHSEEQAQAGIDTATTLQSLIPTYYETRQEAALYVVRCYQILKKAVDIPDYIKVHWPDGNYPVPEQVLFASPAPIFHSGAAVKSHIVATEEATGLPYVIQAAGLLTTPHNSGRSMYQPTVDTRDAVVRGRFISRAAATSALARTGDGLGTQTPDVPLAAAATPTSGGCSKCAGTTIRDGGLFGTKRSKVSVNQRLDAYLDNCEAFDEEVDWELVRTLHKCRK